jgi:hypothetical protein
LEERTKNLSETKDATFSEEIEDQKSKPEPKPFVKKSTVNNNGNNLKILSPEEEFYINKARWNEV